MKVPEGIKREKNQVCKLNKAYGLKQAARCQFEEFEKALKKKGFENSPVDRCIYILDSTDVSKKIYVVLYVDDLLIVTASIEIMNRFKNYLMNRFSMVDLTEIKLFLGLRIERTRKKITLDQNTYIRRVLRKFNMDSCKPINNFLETKLDFKTLNSDEKYNAPCRSVIRCVYEI